MCFFKTIRMRFRYKYHATYPVKGCDNYEQYHTYTGLVVVPFASVVVVKDGIAEQLC